MSLESPQNAKNRTETEMGVDPDFTTMLRPHEPSGRGGGGDRVN